MVFMLFHSERQLLLVVQAIVSYTAICLLLTGGEKEDKHTPRDSIVAHKQHTVVYVECSVVMH